jgi:phosphatidylglycerol:prolipoprotein diacylglycerol transferase
MEGVGRSKPAIEGQSMLPFIEIPNVRLPFGAQLNAFGVVSTIGFVVGASLAMRAAKNYAPGDEEPLRGVIPWAGVGGLCGGHWLHVFAYHPELLTWNDPTLILRVWDGLSSMGGVLGALVGVLWYFRRINVPVMPYLDALALGTAPGWAIARIGCFLVHDHPGIRTDFFLAVRFPGGPRHDLGLYDAMVLTVIAAVVWTVARRRPAQGRLMGILAVAYASARFSLDFLRASDLGFVDRRYGGLTPAQYIVVGLFAVGVWLLLRRAPKPTSAPTLAPTS